MHGLIDGMFAAVQGCYLLVGDTDTLTLSLRLMGSFWWEISIIGLCKVWPGLLGFLLRLQGAADTGTMLWKEGQNFSRKFTK